MQKFISTSRILLDFNKPLPVENISIVQQPLSFPATVITKLSDHWTQQLKDKQSALRNARIESVIGLEPENIANELLHTLFINGKPVMWPGNAVTLRDVKMEYEKVLMTVSEIPYPFIAALNNAAFKKNTGLHSLQLRPPLAICTFVITSDNQLVLTVRGEKTYVYPGRFYGVGGNPANIQFNIVQHQLEEIADELLVQPEEVDATTFRFYGLVEDLELFPGKPDLAGIARIKLSSEELAERFETRPSSQRPPDVAALKMVPFNNSSLQNFLEHDNKLADFCPPAHGGLLLLKKMEFGGDG
ncbi:MAG: hypothetical protein WBB36_04545 [Chitinophagales bacterium]